MNSDPQVVTIFKALGHPVRLQLLHILKQEGEACVCHLEHSLEQRQAYISQQLAILRDAGLVTDRRDGMWVYYALAAPAAVLLLDAADALLESLSIATEPLSPDRSGCPCPHCQESVRISDGDLVTLPPDGM